MVRSIFMGLALATALSGAAAAEPFQTFTDQCLRHNARPDVIAASLDKVSDWHRVPDTLMKDFPAEGVAEPLVFTNVDIMTVMDAPEPPQGFEALMLGEMDSTMMVSVRGVEADLCAVLSPDLDPATAARKIRQLLGMDPIYMDGEEVWMFSRDGDAFRSEAALDQATDEEGLAAVRQRAIYMVAPVDMDGLSFLFLAALRPAN